MAGLKELLGGSKPSVEIRLPLEVPIDLELRLRQGGMEGNLGGLWLRSFDATADMGGLILDFDEPLRAPMERMDLRGSMGGMVLQKVGNASPAELNVDFRMGGLEMDMTGAWVGDSKIDFRASMGGGDIQLPRDVVIRGLDGGDWGVPEKPEISPPVLTFSVTTENGEFEFRE
jgi:hypothetical protein